MKRYRVFRFDFDTRATWLKKQEHEDYETWKKNVNGIIESLKYDLGENNSDVKIKNLQDIGNKTLSILGFHNKFNEQIRQSFIIESYYPAAVAGCALGERILNYLILTLRDDFKDTPAYKKVKKKSCDNWPIMIGALVDWKIIIDVDIAKSFYELNTLRNKVIHFDHATHHQDREIALQVIKLLSEIIEKQFGILSKKLWLLHVSGETYIRKDWENNPFIKKIWLPNCQKVGFKHYLDSAPKGGFVLQDNFDYEDCEITDEEFARIRMDARKQHLDEVFGRK